MAGETTPGLTARIEAALARGMRREEIVGELVQAGVSRTTAERFVDRVTRAAADSPEPPADPGPVADDGQAAGPAARLPSRLALFGGGAAAVAAVLLLGTALRRPARLPAPTAEGSPPDSSTPRAVTDPWPKVYPRIVSVNPPTLPVRDGRAASSTHQVAYEIANAAAVSRAEISLYSPRRGEVQKRVAVPVVEKGTFDLVIDARDFDFGPTVRLRARCPSGVTDWFTLGDEPVTLKQRSAERLQVEAVSPEMIGPQDPDDERDSMSLVTGVTLRGGSLTRDCTPEAEVNGSSIELTPNSNGLPGQVGCLLRWREIGGRPVARRYLELKLVLHGSRVAVEAIARVRFSE